MNGGTPEKRSDKNFTLLTLDIWHSTNEPPPPAVTKRLVKFVGRKASIRPTFSQLDGEGESETEDAPSPTSSSSATRTSLTTTVALSSVSTKAAPPALFLDEHFARLEDFQVASEMLSIKTKQQEAALARGDMLPIKSNF